MTTSDSKPVDDSLPPSDFPSLVGVEGGLGRLENDLAEVVGAQQLRIVLASQMKTFVRCGWLGCYSPAMSCWLRREIGSRWAEDSPAIFLNDTAMTQTPHDNPARLFVTCAVHEAAHAAELGWRPTETEIAYGRKFRAILATAPTNITTIEERQQDRFDNHPPEFVRALFHVWHRMRTRGWKLDMTRLHNWSVYGLLDGWHLEAAIHGELFNLADAPLAKLNEHDPPDDWFELTTPQTDPDATTKQQEILTP